MDKDQAKDMQIDTDPQEDWQDDGYVPNPFQVNDAWFEQWLKKLSKFTNLERIFTEEMAFFNPDHVQCDTSEFLNYMLDKLHEELVDINQQNVSLQSKNRGVSKHTTRDSAVWQIFGSSLMTEFQKGSDKPELKYDPAFSIMVDIQEDECTIEDCLDAYFSPQKIVCSDQSKELNQQIFLEKLPNVLVINVKRFTFLDGNLWKMQEHVNFDEDLLLKRTWLSADL